MISVAEDYDRKTNSMLIKERIKRVDLMSQPKYN